MTFIITAVAVILAIIISVGIIKALLGFIGQTIASLGQVVKNLAILGTLIFLIYACTHREWLKNLGTTVLQKISPNPNQNVEKDEFQNL